MKYTEMKQYRKTAFFSGKCFHAGLKPDGSSGIYEIFVEDDDIWTGFNRIIFLGAKYLFCSYLPCYARLCTSFGNWVGNCLDLSMYLTCGSVRSCCYV